LSPDSSRRKLDESQLISYQVKGGLYEMGALYVNKNNCNSSAGSSRNCQIVQLDIKWRGHNSGDGFGENCRIVQPHIKLHRVDSFELGF
jgi:hypothetical protein